MSGASAHRHSLATAPSWSPRPTHSRTTRSACAWTSTLKRGWARHRRTPTPRTSCTNLGTTILRYAHARQPPLLDTPRVTRCGGGGAHSAWVTPGVSNQTWSGFYETYVRPPLLDSYRLGSISFGMGGSGSGVPFHTHGPVFAEVLHGQKVCGGTLLPRPRRRQLTIRQQQVRRRWRAHSAGSCTLPTPTQCSRP